jgi:hypothetical protein
MHKLAALAVALAKCAGTFSLNRKLSEHPISAAVRESIFE